MYCVQMRNPLNCIDAYTEEEVLRILNSLPVATYPVTDSLNRLALTAWVDGSTLYLKPGEGWTYWVTLAVEKLQGEGHSIRVIR